MYRVKTMNKIAQVGLDQLPASNFRVGDDLEH